MVDGDHNILLKTVQNTTDPKVLVESANVVDENGRQIHWDGWALSGDAQYVLFQTDRTKQWRHSSHSNFWIHRLSDSKTFAVKPSTSPPVISRCIWSPAGHSLAFVEGNNLFVLPGDNLHGSPIQVTQDGSEVVFNGVPDWVYEEEVFETDSTMWWSPDGSTVAFLRMDEADVKNYKLQYYNPSDDAFEPHQYPTELDMK